MPRCVVSPAVSNNDSHQQHIVGDFIAHVGNQSLADRLQAQITGSADGGSESLSHTSHNGDKVMTDTELEAWLSEPTHLILSTHEHARMPLAGRLHNEPKPSSSNIQVATINVSTHMLYDDFDDKDFNTF